MPDWTPRRASLVPLLALAACAPTTAEVQPLDPRLGEVITWTDDQLDGWHVPGVAIAVVERGAVVGAWGAGVTEAGSDDPMTGQTLFRIGSLTKMATGMVAIQQASAGRLDLEAPAAAALGDLTLESPASLEDFTLLDLLSHQSGLQAGGMPDDCDTDPDADAVVLQASAPEWSAWYPTGELFLYSDEGFALAGYATERAAGMDYVDLVEEGVFGPAGMETATFDRDEVRGQSVALGHSVDTSSGEVTATHPITNRDCRAEYPAGGAIGSAADLGQLALLLLNEGEGVLHPEQWQTFTTEGWRSSSSSSYGFGLNVTRWNDHQVLTHTGSVPGYNTLLWVMPEVDLGVALLVNADHTTTSPPEPWSKPTQLVLLHTLETFLGLPHEDYEVKAQSAEDWTAFVGHYEGTDGQGGRDVGIDGDTLVVVDEDGDEIELYPYTSGSFKYPRVSSIRNTTYWASLEFEEGASGEVEWLIGESGVWRREDPG